MCGRRRWQGSSSSSSLCAAADQDDGYAPGLHLSGHLAPGAGVAAGGVQTVITHGACDSVAMTHGYPQGEQGRWD